MVRLPVKSSYLSSVGYNYETNTLEVEFSDKQVIRYYRVSTRLYNNLLSAPSIGQYFIKYIRDRHARRRLTNNP